VPSGLLSGKFTTHLDVAGVSDVTPAYTATASLRLSR
jgi:hypothetical protein